jgi:hypothetical protein
LGIKFRDLDKNRYFGQKSRKHTKIKTKIKSDKVIFSSFFNIFQDIKKGDQQKREEKLGELEKLGEF